MKRWPLFAVALVGTLLLIGAAITQPPAEPPPGRPPGGPADQERALEKLKLADKDQGRARDVLQAHHEKMRRQFDRNRDEFLRQVKEVLTPEQFQQFEKTAEARRGGPGRPPGWDAPGALERTF